MPIYEYVCQSCNHHYDALILSSAEPDPICPVCGDDKVKRLMSAGNIHGSQKSSNDCLPQGGG